MAFRILFDLVDCRRFKGLRPRLRCRSCSQQRKRRLVAGRIRPRRRSSQSVSTEVFVFRAYFRAPAPLQSPWRKTRTLGCPQLFGHRHATIDAKSHRQTKPNCRRRQTARSLLRWRVVGRRRRHRRICQKTARRYARRPMGHARQLPRRNPLGLRTNAQPLGTPLAIRFLDA